MKRVILTSLVLAATSLLSAAEAALTVSDTEKRWETARQSELKFDPPQTDLSAYRRVTLRLCAEGNLPATIMVLFHSAHAKGRGYYAAPLTITRPGWQSCTLELNELKTVPHPRRVAADHLDHAEQQGWEAKVPAGFRLKIGKIVLSAGAVPDEEMRSAAETAAETASPFLTIPGGNRQWETAQQAELKFEPPQTDLSAYRRVTLRLRPAGSLPATIMVLFHSAHAKGRGYYAAPLTLNSPDWNDYTLELNRLTPFRSPAGWHQITSITLNSKGWEAKVPAGFRLEIGEIRPELGRSRSAGVVGRSVLARQLRSGDDRPLEKRSATHGKTRRHRLSQTELPAAAALASPHRTGSLKRGETATDRRVSEAAPAGRRIHRH